jgi:Na+-transporting NADH:ubiquinone oxidoreductase subunit NqrB
MMQSLTLPMAPLRFFQKDGRHFQIAFLGTFLLAGIFWLGWDVSLPHYGAVFLSGLLTQAICVRFTTRDYRSLKSALITCLALCLLLKANSPWTMAFAASVAVAGKFLIRYNGKHIFNPANLGIILAVALTGDAWISPGQWGSGVVLLFLIGVLGFAVLFRVGRVDTSLAFLAAFAGLQFLRNVVWLGWPMDYFSHQMTSGAVLLFAFFMITDPKTTPNARTARILWAAGIGVAAFLLSNWYYVHTAPIWTLFFAMPLTAVLDKWIKGKRFEW